MHHSTRQISCWTNDRGSLIDGFIQSMILASVGIVMGVEPEQFAWLVLVGELVQNFSHANVRIAFGPLFDRVFVSPKFRRLHRMLVDPTAPNLHNCNFGQVFSIWDVVFGTALYNEPLRPTGVGDPMVDDDNNHGLVGLHWNAAKRFWGAVPSAVGMEVWRGGFRAQLRADSGGSVGSAWVGASCDAAGTGYPRFGDQHAGHNWRIGRTGLRGRGLGTWRERSVKECFTPKGRIAMDVHPDIFDHASLVAATRSGFQPKCLMFGATLPSRRASLVKSACPSGIPRASR